MRGRKPKPTHLRLVEGNRGRRPLNAREPMPQGDLVDSPGWFSVDQQRVWAYAIASAPIGLLKRLDREILAIWCVACELWERAIVNQARIDAAAGLPLLTRTPDGYLVQSPYLPIINKQAAIMLRAAVELGFTPSSRSRIELPDGNGKTDQAAKYLD